MLYRKYYNIPKSLFHKCHEEGKLPLLYYYFRLRNIYKANIFFKKSIAKIAEQVGLKKSSLYHYLKEMESLGWITYNHRGDIQLKGINKLKTDKYELCYAVPVKETKREQIAVFRLVACTQNMRFQDKNIAKKAELKKLFGLGLPLPTYAVKFMRKTEFNPSNKLRPDEKRISLSNKKIGSLNFVSKVTGQRTQKLWNEMGLIRSQKNVHVWKKNISYITYFLDFKLKGRYFYSEQKNGCVFSQRPNLLFIHDDIFYNKNIRSMCRGLRTTIKTKQ